jgi:hypothetical protein
MKTSILMIIIPLIIIIESSGQDHDTLINYSHNSISISFGQNQIREMNLLPMVHKGKETGLSYEFEKVHKNLQQFQTFLTCSRMKTSLEEMSVSVNIRLGFSYSYNFLLFSNKKLKYYAGPQTGLCYSIMLYPNWDESHSYWADHLSVGAGNALSVAFRNEKEWFTSLNFSLLGFFSRPDDLRDFKMDDYTAAGVLKALNSNLESGLMNKVLHINFKTEYRFPVLNNKREAFIYNIDITRMSGNNGCPVFQIINRIGIKIML